MMTVAGASVFVLFVLFCLFCCVVLCLVVLSLLSFLVFVCSVRLLCACVFAVCCLPGVFVCCVLFCLFVLLGGCLVGVGYIAQTGVGPFRPTFRVLKLAKDRPMHTLSG